MVAFQQLHIVGFQRCTFLAAIYIAFEQVGCAAAIYWHSPSRAHVTHEFSHKAERFWFVWWVFRKRYLLQTKRKMCWVTWDYMVQLAAQSAADKWLSTVAVGTVLTSTSGSTGVYLALDKWDRVLSQPMLGKSSTGHASQARHLSYYFLYKLSSVWAINLN